MLEFSLLSLNINLHESKRYITKLVEIKIYDFLLRIYNILEWILRYTEDTIISIRQGIEFPE